MRFPYIISTNTKSTYTPSPQCLALLNEFNRKLHPEDFQWDNDFCPKLEDFCVWTISKNFKDHPILDELPCHDRHHLLELLSTDLPLELVVPLINDEIYWNRRYIDKYGLPLTKRQAHWNWKHKYMERYTQQIIEEAQPEYQDEFNMDDILQLCRPFITHLNITQLQVWKPPLNWVKEDWPEVFPVDHVNFVPILTQLTEIQEIDIVYGMDEMSEEAFKWNAFKLSVKDCKNLGEAVLVLEHLTRLCINRSRIEDDHARALVKGLLKNVTLIELDLSHCHIEDQGALCIAKLMTVHPKLEILKLADNRIGQIGAEGIGFAILEETCCPLVHLDVRLNPLKFDGAQGIFRALVRAENKPKELNISTCDIEDVTAIRVGQMINLNHTLEYLNVSNNWLGDQGGEAIIKGLTNNRTLKDLDIRETYIPRSMVRQIKKLLKRNILGLEEIEFEEDIEEEEEEQEEEEEEEEEMEEEEEEENPDDL